MRLDAFLLRYFRRVIAVSGSMRDDLVAQGLRPERVAVIQNAIDLPGVSTVEIARREARSRLGFDDGEFVIGYVGRLSPEKGLKYLIDAVSAQPPADRPWRLLIVGDGPQRADLEATVRAVGLEPRIVFAGFQADTSAWYAAMDAFVLPSLTEGTPMALLEAMAHRLPVVASNVGGVPAVVSDRVNGMMVPPADGTLLSSALRELSCRDDLRAAMATAGYETVKRDFDPGSWAGRVRGIYEEAMREHAAA
jgi:glycosyltransferase involved in cell wall biosynthesis